MTSRREAIFAEIEARLRTVDGVLEVARMPFVDPIEFPALHLFDEGQQIVDLGAAETRYRTTATIEGYLEAAGGSDAHGALLALYAAVVARALTEPPLGGLAETVDEGAMRIIVAPLASKSRLCFSLDLIITYAAHRSDPARPL